MKSLLEGKVDVLIKETLHVKTDLCFQSVYGLNM